MRAIRNLYVGNEVTYKTCDSCNERKIVYPRLAGAYADIIVSDITSYKNPSKSPFRKGGSKGDLECAGDGRVWVYLCSECLQALRERRRCRCEFNINMTTTQAEMPLGFMLVGLGRLGFSKHVIARHDVPKQSLFPIILSVEGRGLR